MPQALVESPQNKRILMNPKPSALSAILIFTGATIAFFIYITFIAGVLYDAYFAGVVGPLYLWRLPSALQIIVLSALFILTGISVYLIKAAIGVTRGKPTPLIGTCICSLLLSPMGILCLAGTLIAYKTTKNLSSNQAKGSGITY